ncbi:MAG: HepT-like ribonuclease domain-containing protein [Nocardioidaceae bacterium]
MTESRRKAHDAAERVIAVCDVLAGLIPPDIEAFVADVRTQWAVEMGLIRIGEAVNQIPDEVLERFPEQPWRQIVAMRNFAAHQYDDLDPRRVWRTVTSDVPLLRAYLADTVMPELDE